MRAKLSAGRFATWATLLLAAVWGGWLQAGNNNNFNFGSAVGGVSIDAEGVLRNATTDATGRLEQLRKEQLKPVPADLATQTKLRKISLKGLEAVLAAHAKNAAPLPDEVRYLAGLQRIQYIFVYPEAGDIVLAGPAEGWKSDGQGNVVGVQSGWPVLLLDDLLVALRTLSAGEQRPITCSIDPTPEGVQRLQAFLKQQGGRIGANPPATIAAIEQALGPQTITITGVESNSHLARVLVAADYRMKRLGMGFEAAPIAKMPSFLQLAGGGTGDLFPRWWMAPNYEAIQTSPNRDVWELRGQAVQVMTEDAFFTANGERKTTGKKSPKAEQWAQTMTSRFDELADKLPIFGELRNVMDLAVVAALISQHDLAGKAGLDLGVLLDGAVDTTGLETPKATPTQASFQKQGTRYVITASGGVDLNPWEVADKIEQNDALANLHEKAAADPTISRWWWN